MQIISQEFRPTSVLDHVVDCYWYNKGDGNHFEMSPLQSCLPMGMVELIIHLSDNRCEGYLNGKWTPFPEAFLVGIMEKPIIWKMPGGTALFGIRFKPEGIIQLFQSPLSGLQNTFIDISSFLGKNQSSIISNIQTASDNFSRIFFTEVFLQNQLSKNFDNRRNYFSQAVEIIRNADIGLSVDQLSRAVCISERQLQRTFKEKIGVSPKSYHRIIRFKKAYQFLQTNPKANWIDIVYHFGYADQAHFIRDFKEFSGRTPKGILSN